MYWLKNLIATLWGDDDMGDYAKDQSDKITGNPNADKVPLGVFIANPKPKAKTVGDVFTTVDTTAAQILAAQSEHLAAVDAVHAVFDTFEVVKIGAKTFVRDKDALPGYREVQTATEATVVA